MKNIQEDIRSILSTIFKRTISPEEDVSMENEDLWDSLKHIEIIVTIEEELGVSFAPEDIPQLTSVSKIVKKIEELQS